ncbi:MAG: aminoglycoside phosphotransferase family protein [Planctomycetia bacterium]|nr:aminoglycoside phosphotransferase family protein [Planctomycetia bacterium]
MIGIDFDNTIVCYDEVFGRVAVEQGLVPPEAATSKTAIRDYLRAAGAEGRWTELQGIIYGPRMMDAPPFSGVVEFFAACRAASLPVAIISHRTRFPYLGERHDLHAAARDWLARHGFHDAEGLGLPMERVFFEETKEAKLARVAELGCTHFIDDLPELLTHPLFPRDVRRILFDPQGQHGSGSGVEVVPSWHQIAEILPVAKGQPTLIPQKPLAEVSGHGPRADAITASSISGLCTAAGLSPPTAIERLAGGGNNRVYRVETAAGPVLLKEYFQHPSDPRDRLGGEQAFCRFAWGMGVRALPQPLACDRNAGLALYEFIPGRKLTPGEVTAAHVEEAAAFFTAVHHHRHDPGAADLPIASEACFSLAEHLACVDRRIARLDRIEPESDLHRQAATIVAERLRPLWERARSAVLGCGRAIGAPLDSPLPAAAHVISSSDFGFHNCIATDAGLRFIDFEYAGWDDPAKTVCDFFCQPAVPVPREYFESFLRAVAGLAPGADIICDRVALLLPVYELKWCCIMLNEFLPVGDTRRAFARTDESLEHRQMIQLQKVETALARLEV